MNLYKGQQISALCTVITGLWMGGCASSQNTDSIPVNRQLMISHHTGGAHYRMLIHGGWWYQLFGNSLLVFNPKTMELVNELRLGDDGETGPAVDIAAVASQLFIVLEDDSLLELSIDNPTSPSIVRVLDADVLGIRPKRLSIVHEDVYVSGVGGVLRLRDKARFFSSATEPVGRVVMSDYGLVACVGRRVHRLNDENYVGSASDLQMAPNDVHGVGTFVFARQGEQGALVGLMSPDIREIDAKSLTEAVEGRVHCVRIDNQSIWVVSDIAVVRFAQKDESLNETYRISALGVRDIAILRPNYVALCGTFGRAIYRLEDDGNGPGHTYVAAHREASRLSHAAFDGQHVMAGSNEGTWLYLINSRADLTNRVISETQPPTIEAATVSSSARISGDRLSIVITTEGDSWTHGEPDRCKLHCVIAIDGEFWIGHDRGITVLGNNPTDPVVDRLRIPGPVKYIFPLLIGGGGVYVSEFGGFGVAEIEKVPMVSIRN